MASRNDLEDSKRRSESLMERLPRAVSARYDPKSRRIVVELSSRLILSFLPEDVEGLEGALPAQLNKVELSPTGFGIHFPALDADIYVPGLLDGLLGSKSWMAARLGQTGGRSSSKAKKDASRANGRLGGRPRKAVQR